MTSGPGCRTVAGNALHPGHVRPHHPLDPGRRRPRRGGGGLAGAARGWAEAALARLVDTDLHHLSDVQLALWSFYLVAALVLPLYHVRPIVRYLRGTSGIGDACIRTECIQCLWRVPALLFSVFVLPSLPLFLSIFLDMLGRIGRIAAMRISHRRWLRGRAPAADSPPSPATRRA